MEKTLEMAILERSTAKAAVEKWNQEYEMFMQNVDEKIQQQKDTYNELERKIGQVQPLVEKLKRGLDIFKAKKIAEATISFLSGVIGAVFGNPPDTDEAMTKIEKIKRMIEVLKKLAEMMRKVKKAFDVNINFDVSSLKDVEFEATSDFQEALKLSSTFVKRARDFNDIKDTADYALSNLRDDTSGEVAEVEELQKLMSSVAFNGQQLVQLVSTCDLSKIQIPFNVACYL